jgi:hypothetical protein
MFAMTILGYTLNMMAAVALFMFWILLAFWPATIARSKGHSFIGWFIMSLFFWWITLFVALFMKDRSQPGAMPA